ncbi:MAG TPA: SpoIIE family protein phosphatase, partial [bacterium]
MERTPTVIAHFFESSPVTDRGIRNILESEVKTTPEIFGSAAAFEPYSFRAGSRYYSPYVFKQNDGTIRFTMLGNDQYLYETMDWYQIPKVLGRAVWSEPYYDEGGGGILMTTYSVPFYRTVRDQRVFAVEDQRVFAAEDQRVFAGVVTADISLDWLQSLVASIKIGKTGYGFLLSRNGTYVIHPDRSLIMNETIFSAAESRNYPEMRGIGRRMVRGESGFARVINLLQGKRSYLFFTPLESSGWTLGVIFPEDELMADINRLNRKLVILAMVGVGLLLAVVIAGTGTITRPLRRLADTATEIAAGKLDVDLPAVSYKDEVGILTESFEYMKISLKEYIQNLTETTAAKERIESELKIAHDIQMGILPKLFPPFPDRKELDIHATLVPAKEVGGDFYDFFFVDDDHMVFTIGDVSGKGVPASLLMAVTSTLIKAKSGKEISPDRIMAGVNDDLCAESDSNMFVTCFLGILDLKTGNLAYSNGGHNIPYWIHRNGTVGPFDNTTSLALGVLNTFAYETKSVHFESGDCLILYTDGITEAMDPKAELYSEERFESFLNRMKSLSSKDLVEHTMAEVKRFTAEAPQSDDITLVVIRYLGPNRSEERPGTG